MSFNNQTRQPAERRATEDIVMTDKSSVSAAHADYDAALTALAAAVESRAAALAAYNDARDACDAAAAVAADARGVYRAAINAYDAHDAARPR